MAIPKEVKRKNLRKNLSFDPKSYRYIRKLAKSHDEKMAPFILRAVTLLDSVGRV